MPPVTARPRRAGIVPSPDIDRTSRRRTSISTGPPVTEPRYRPDLPPQNPDIDRTSRRRTSISTGPPVTEPRYRPDLPPPNPDIDRTPRRRTPISTGPPAAEPRYRPDLPPQNLDIDRTSRRRTPISTGPPAAEPRYRPDLPPPNPDIDRTSRHRTPISTGVKRHELLPSWETPTLTHPKFWAGEAFRVGEGRGGGSGATEATPVTDPRYRPEQTHPARPRVRLTYPGGALAGSAVS